MIHGFDPGGGEGAVWFVAAAGGVPRFVTACPGGLK
jgi:hypothetical protein